MADLNVVMDKLHGFETADDLAEFFRGYGILARPSCATECAISKFIIEEADILQQDITTTQDSVAVFIPMESEGLTIRSTRFTKVDFPNTDAMAEFVERYDAGYYPLLVEKGYEVE